MVGLRVIRSKDGVVAAGEGCDCAAHRILQGEEVDAERDKLTPTHVRTVLKTLGLRLGEASMCEDWQACLTISYQLHLMTGLMMREARHRLLATRSLRQA